MQIMYTNNANNAATITAVNKENNSYGVQVKESSSTLGSLENSRIINTNQTNSTADPPSPARSSPSSSPFWTMYAVKLKDSVHDQMCLIECAQYL